MRSPFTYPIAGVARGSRRALQTGRAHETLQRKKPAADQPPALVRTRARSSEQHGRAHSSFMNNNCLSNHRPISLPTSRQHLRATLWLSGLVLYEVALPVEAGGPGKYREELPKFKFLKQMLVLRKKWWVPRIKPPECESNVEM